MTRRQRVLAHLAEHPALTTHEIARALGGRRGSEYARLLTDMERKGEVLPAKAPRAGRPVTVWNVAPPGTKPRFIPDPDKENKRRRDREYKRRQRARDRGETPDLDTGPVTARRLNLPVAAVPDWGKWRLQAECRGEDPDLFFSWVPEDISKAQQVCARCPVISQCRFSAEANDEQFGIWAGVDRNPDHAEQNPDHAEQIAS